VDSKADVATKCNFHHRERVYGKIVFDMNILYQMTLVHCAIIGGAHDVLDYLLDEELASIDWRSGAHPEYLINSATALHFSGFFDKPLVAELCVQKGADVNAWMTLPAEANLAFDTRYTSRWLHNGLFNSVCSLLQKKSHALLTVLLGADVIVNTRNGMGLSTLQFAVAYGWDELVSTCLDAIEETSIRDFVNEANPVTGDTALMMASQTLQIGQVNFLLAQNADPNQRCFDTEDNDCSITIHPIYSQFKSSLMNEGRPFSFRNLSALAFAAVGTNLDASFKSDAKELEENLRLEVLDALERAGAVLGPRDSKVLELAEDMSHNARVVEWLRKRMPATA
jgi:hypothetical protein